MNIELILDVANHIESDPKKFDMWSWFYPLPENVTPRYIDRFTQAYHDCSCCRTTACIAGWTVILYSTMMRNEGISKNNIEHFALTELFDSDQKWKWVFFSEKWPKIWQDRYLFATNSANQVNVLANRAKVAAELLRSIANNPESFSDHCSLILKKYVS